MNTVTAAFTVFFDDPFWVGVYERSQGGTLEVCRVVYGAQPKDGQVYEGLLKNWGKLRFSPPVEAGKAVRKLVFLGTGGEVANAPP